MQTSNYDAGYGRNAGSNVNVVMKSGTNDWHGSLFEYFRNTDLDANNWFSKRSGVARGVLNQNQYGGTAGGRSRKISFCFLCRIKERNRRTVSLRWVRRRCRYLNSLRRLRQPLEVAACPDLRLPLARLSVLRTIDSGGLRGLGIYIPSPRMAGRALPLISQALIPTDEVQCNGSNL